ncbi:hypothetical protein RI367_000412 [Sorochytrium milnesiophthora]
MTPLRISALVFDLGGVCVRSPLSAINQYEQELGLPKNFLNIAIASAGPDGSFQRLERGELVADEFVPLFHRELNDRRTCIARYNSWPHHRRPAPPHLDEASFVYSVDGRVLFDRIVDAGSQVVPEMLQCIRRIKDQGHYKLGCITNDFKLSQTNTSSQHLDELLRLFDVVVSSSRVGLRKPDQRIYDLACQRLGVAPTECVFLDDIKANILGARKVGMQTIHVRHIPDAIQQLEHLLLPQNQEQGSTQRPKL